MKASDVLDLTKMAISSSNKVLVWGQWHRKDRKIDLCSVEHKSRVFCLCQGRKASELGTLKDRKK